MAKLIYEIPADKAKEGAAAIRKALLDMGVQAEVVDKAFTKQERQLARQGRAYDRLARDLDPAIRKSQDFERAQHQIARALEIGKIDQAEHNRMLGLARQRYAEAEAGAATYAESLSQVKSTALAAVAAVAAAGATLGKFALDALAAREALFRLEFAVSKRPGSGLEAGQLSGLAEQFKASSTFDDEAIREAMATLARFESVDSGNIERITALVIDFAWAMKTDLVGAARLVGKALDEPGQGLRALSDAFGFLDEPAKLQIKNLMEAGHEAEAAAILFEKLEGSIGTIAEKAAATSFGEWEQLKRGINDATKALGEFAIKRVETFGQEIEEATFRLLTGDLSGDKWAQAQEQRATATQAAANASGFFAKILADEIQAEKDAEAATKKAEKSLSSLRAEKDATARAASALLDRLYPIEALNKQFSRDATTLASHYSEIAGGADLYADALERLNARRLEELGMTQQLIPLLEEERSLLAGIEELPGGTTGGSLLIDEISPQIERLQAEWEDFADQAAQATEDHFKGAFLQIAMDMAATGDPFLDGMIEIFARLLIEWAATQAQMLAISAKRIAAEKAMQTGIFGPTQSGGNISGQNLTGFSKYLSGGAGQISSGGYSYASYGQAAAYGAGFVAAIAIALNQQKTSGRAEAYAEITGTLEQLSTRDVETNRAGRAKAGQVAGAANAVIEMLRGFYSQVTSTVARELPSSITLGREGQGKKTNWVVHYADGLIKGFGGDMQAAMEFAAIQAAKESELAGLDPQVQTAIQNSTAETWSAFQDDVAFAMEYTSLGLDAVARQFRSTVDQYREMIDRAVELGMDAQLGLDAMAADLEAQRNSLLGIQESPEERIRREAAAWEAERQLTMAQLQLQDAELAIKEQELRADLAFLQVEGETIRARLDLRGKALQIEGGYLDAEAQMLGASLQHLAAITKAREIIAGTLDTLGGLGISEADIAGAIKRAGSGFGRHVDRFGGHVRQLRETWESNMDRFREVLLEARQDESISPLTDRERLTESFGGFMALLDAASGGNVTAQGELPDAYRDLLALAEEFSGGAGGLGFLGLGDDYEQFFNRLEAMSLAFIDAPRPDKLFERVVFDERMHRTASDHLANDRSARAENDRNLKALKVTEHETKTAVVSELRSGFGALRQAILSTPRYAA